MRRAQRAGREPAEVGRTLLLILKSGRPIPTIIIAVCTGVSVQWATSSGWGIAAFRALPMAMVAMGGYLLNDVFDRAKDQLAGRNRPVAQGLVTGRAAAVGAVILLGLAVVLECWVGSVNSVATIASGVAGVALYSPLAARVPLAKGLMTALLACLPFVYAATAAGAVGASFVVLAAVVCFTLGREILIDVKDAGGDIRYGLRTVPFYLGATTSSRLAWCLMFAPSVALTVLASDSLGGSAAVASITCLYLACWRFGVRRGDGLQLTRVAMLLGSVAAARVAFG